MSKPRCLKLLEKCMNMKQLKQTHAHLITYGLGNHSFTLSRLLAFCSNPTQGSLHHAYHLFQTITHPTLCIYNTMIKAFLHNGAFLKTIEIYSAMLQTGVSPDNYTLPYVLKACGYLGEGKLGEQVHGDVLKLGFGEDMFVGNSLIGMYVLYGCMVEGRKLFDEMPLRSVVSWTVMINGYAKKGDVYNARLMFDCVDMKDRGIWGSMISGYVQNNCFKEGLEMFRLMQSANIEPDEAVFVSVLCACAHLGAMDIGIWIHRYLERVGFSLSVRLGTALIDMYARCGNLNLARNLFDDMRERDTICWNVMISGLAMHGDGKNALELFAEMENAGFLPDDITFIAVLTACSYSGMTLEGLQIFSSMLTVNGIQPKSEHYGCMVDILCRAGLVEEAKEVMQTLLKTFSPSEEAIAWRALLAACCDHRETKLAGVAAERLFQLEHHSGAYVLLSNMYSADGKYDNAKGIRKKMNRIGVEKTPGCSSLEVNGLIHEFIAGEEMHPHIEDIYKLLVKMNEHMDSCG